jgi:hypothetical protein
VANLTDERVSVEFAVLVFVHLDTRFVVVDAFSNDTETGEHLVKFFLVDVLWETSDVDRGVDALLFLVLLLLCILLREWISRDRVLKSISKLTFSSSTALRFLLGSIAGSSSSTPAIL